MSAPASLILAGAGKMGGAMLQGWLHLGLEAAKIIVLDPQISPEMAALCQNAGVALNPPLDTLGAPEVLVLAIKPQMLDSAAPACAALAGAQTMVVSILAGKTIADLSARLPHARALVRAMPNLPAAIGRGTTGVFGNAAMSPAQKARADYLLKAVGHVEWVDSEALIDAVTAVSGSGPAYVFYLAECLAKAGEHAGLEPALAMRLARATVEGAGELMFRSPGIAAAQLRTNVTSPGGTTAAALEVLMAGDGLAPLMQRAIAAAKRRAGELSG